MPEHAGAHWAPDGKHGFEMPINIQAEIGSHMGSAPGPAQPQSDSHEENRYKGDPNEHFKQPARVGCNRTSRKTCRKEFKKERRTLFGRDTKKSESGRSRRSIWGIALYRSR